MKRWLVALVAAISLMLGALVATSGFRSLFKQADEGAAEALLAEVALLRSEIKQLKGAPRLIVMPSQPAQAVATPTEEEEEVDPRPAEVVQPERRHEQAAAELEERLANEPREAAWGTAITAQIRESVTARVPNARVLETECGSSLCRVVLSHGSPEDQQAIGQALASEEPFQPGVLYEYDKQANPPRTTLYVLRQGRSFREDGGRAL